MNEAIAQSGVSIQLISPASGNLSMMLLRKRLSKLLSFHSINIPSEWESETKPNDEARSQSVSIQ
ncbi:hypothetical protein H6G91_39925 [Nostoc muscorum FACHB-395]|nr:hypothetical protein [Desmonostoc muscorum FACHB-395]